MSRYCRAKQIGPQETRSLPMSIVPLLSSVRLCVRPLLSPAPERPCQGLPRRLILRPNRAWPSLSRRIEVLRKAQLEADKARLEQVASAQVSYGHSDGRVETKEQFINGGHDPQAGRQVARLPRAQGGGGRQCRRRAAVVTTSA